MFKKGKYSYFAWNISKGSNPNKKCPENVGKIKKNGGGATLCKFFIKMFSRVKQVNKLKMCPWKSTTQTCEKSS